MKEEKLTRLAPMCIHKDINVDNENNKYNKQLMDFLKENKENLSLYDPNRV